MDIRKFLSPPSNSKKIKSQEKDSVKLPTKNAHKRKGVLFDSDSDDEEDPIPKNVRKSLSSADIITNSGDELIDSKKLSNKKKRNRNLQETTPSAFFEKYKNMTSKPSVKRKAAGESSLKRSKISKKNPEEELVIIDDDDLEEINPKPKKRVGKSESTVSSKLAKAANKRGKQKQSEDKEKKQSPQKLKKNAVSPSPSSKSDVVRKNNKKRETSINESNKNERLKRESVPKTNSESSKTKLTPEKSDAFSPIESDTASAKKAKFLKFQQWQNRSGPSAPGSKEVPEGKSFCFERMTFVITGVQESLSREEIRSLVERYGGKVTTGVSSRTTYLITGADAGETKTKKAQQHKTKIITEDDFLDLLRTLPAQKSKYEVCDEPAVKRKKESPPKKESNKAEKITTKQEVKRESSMPTLLPNCSTENSQSSQESCSSLSASQKPEPSGTDLMWVDKYKPKTIKQIIGQQGASSNMQKLLNWLRNWHSNHRTAEGRAKPKPRINQWGGGDPTGASLKAALLSGPPGVGKTTTASLVCKELGLPFVELNASDQRSKRTLKEEVFASVQNTSISNLMGKVAKEGSQHVLIMDEVDGMAGNEDRGGMQELIQIIKSTKIPIICMCNDRSSQKVRSLANHCFDLRFQRPRVEQITSAIMSICFKEGVKIQAPAMQAIIRGCNQDIRQILHNLNMIKAKDSSLSYDDAKKHADRSQKDVNLGIFEVARKLLSPDTARMSLLDKSNLFFMDYSMVPKFIQENYVHVTPFAAQGNTREQLEILSKTADSIATGDLIESSMRREMTWSMLPTLGLMSTVLPCDYMRGSMHGMINFPAFFGKLSTTGKNHRLLQELKFHASLSTNGSTEETFNLDLLPYLRWHLSRPLLQQSRTGELEVPKVTKLLDDYNFIKDDFDSLMEVGQFQGKPNYMSQVESKVKAAFTRTYNKESHLTPYAVESAAAKKKRKPVAMSDDFGEEGDSQNEQQRESDEDDVDGMIKEVKKKPKPASKNRTKKKDAAEPSKTKRGKKK